MASSSLLNYISIVLVDTKTPGNIGAAARCMMNMGLSRLVLVRPRKDISGDAVKLAAGADEIIEKAPRFQTLKEAVTGCGLILGTSRHLGRQRKNILTPRAAAELSIPLLQKNTVAVVFGGEVNGLDNDDIALCHELISIPTSDEFPSLNLSHAVMIVAYELFLAAHTEAHFSERTLAAASDVEQFYHHLQSTLEEIGFIDKARPDRMMFSLRQLFGRARLDEREVKILRGVLSQVDRAAKNVKKD